MNRSDYAWYVRRWLETPKARILIGWGFVFFLTLLPDLFRILF